MRIILQPRRKESREAWEKNPDKSLKIVRRKIARASNGIWAQSLLPKSWWYKKRRERDILSQMNRETTEYIVEMKKTAEESQQVNPKKVIEIKVCNPEAQSKKQPKVSPGVADAVVLKTAATYNKTTQTNQHGLGREGKEGVNEPEKHIARQPVPESQWCVQGQLPGKAQVRADPDSGEFSLIQKQRT